MFCLFLFDFLGSVVATAIFAENSMLSRATFICHENEYILLGNSFLKWIDERERAREKKNCQTDNLCVKKEEIVLSENRF